MPPNNIMSNKLNFVLINVIGDGLKANLLKRELLSKRLVKLVVKHFILLIVDAIRLNGVPVNAMEFLKKVNLHGTLVKNFLNLAVQIVLLGKVEK